MINKLISLLETKTGLKWGPKIAMGRVFSIYSEHFDFRTITFMLPMSSWTQFKILEDLGKKFYISIPHDSFKALTRILEEEPEEKNPIEYEVYYNLCKKLGISPHQPKAILNRNGLAITIAAYYLYQKYPAGLIRRFYTGPYTAKISVLIPLSDLELMYDYQTQIFPLFKPVESNDKKSLLAKYLASKINENFKVSHFDEIIVVPEQDNISNLRQIIDQIKEGLVSVDSNGIIHISEAGFLYDEFWDLEVMQPLRRIMAEGILDRFLPEELIQVISMYIASQPASVLSQQFIPLDLTEFIPVSDLRNLILEYRSQIF